MVFQTLIRFIYYIYNYRLLYYLPMEMWNLMNASLKALLNEQYKLVAELREENKKLKEKNKLLDNENMCLNAEIKDREQENKKLKEERDKYYAEWHWRHS